MTIVDKTKKTPKLLFPITKLTLPSSPKSKWKRYCSAGSLHFNVRNTRPESPFFASSTIIHDAARKPILIMKNTMEGKNQPKLIADMASRTSGQFENRISRRIAITLIINPGSQRPMVFTIEWLAVLNYPPGAAQRKMPPGYLNITHHLHAFLTFFRFEQSAFSGNITPIAFR